MSLDPLGIFDSVEAYEERVVSIHDRWRFLTVSSWFRPFSTDFLGTV